MESKRDYIFASFTFIFLFVSYFCAIFETDLTTAVISFFTLFTGVLLTIIILDDEK